MGAIALLMIRLYGFLTCLALQLSIYDIQGKNDFTDLTRSTSKLISSPIHSL